LTLLVALELEDENGALAKVVDAALGVEAGTAGCEVTAGAGTEDSWRRENVVMLSRGRGWEIVSRCFVSDAGRGEDM